MADILIIETATRICSVALARNGVVTALRESGEKNVHASMTVPFILEVLKESGLGPGSVDAVAVSRGPGSYTGLRIGVSTAKGICYAVDKPLISVSTLQAMAFGAMKAAGGQEEGASVRYRPMIDARRMEVYTALYDKENKPLTEVEAKVIDADTFNGELEKHIIWFFGDGAEKCRSLFGDHPNSRFLPGFMPSARWMAPLAEKKWQQNEFEDLAYFEPFYLKDFIAGIPRVRGLR